MKKVLFSIGGLLIAAFVAVSFAGTVNEGPDAKKPCTVINKENPETPCCAAPCKQTAEDKTISCEKAENQTAACKTSDGKCNPEAGKCTDDCKKECCETGSAVASTTQPNPVK
jgi:hypothetical protein